MTKRCIRCNQLKPLDVFEKKKRELNRRNICKTCRTHAARTTNALKRAHIRKHGRPSPFSKCAICKKCPKTVVFDHCHVTAMFRGWICRGCNAAIGKLGDNYKGIQRAVMYLREFEAAQTLSVMAYL